MKMTALRVVSVCVFAAFSATAVTVAGQAGQTAKPAPQQKPAPAPTQKPAPATQAAPPPASMAATARPFVAIGCMSLQKPAAGGQPAVFAVTDTRGDKPTVYRLDGDPKELDWHVGHYVEVAGPLTAGAGGTYTLKVNSLIYIAMTCPKS
jgi:hypothetical protein